jgi:hypothetical protein
VAASIIITFHVVMLLLAGGIAFRVIGTQRVSALLGYLHNSIGITTPSPGQVRMVALIWIGTVIVTVDGCILTLVMLASLTHSR